MRRTFLFLSFLLLCVYAQAQKLSGPLPTSEALSGAIIRTNFDLPEVKETSSNSSGSIDDDQRSRSAASAVASPIPPEPGAQQEIEPRGINWTRTGEQSFFFLGIQHGARLAQRKTRRELGGKFFDEWVNAVDGLSGWGDGDSILTNYIGHPMMGAISGYILIQNDPNGIRQEFDTRSKEYWNSRLRAMGWATFYSTQFELGPISESTIGHVGKIRGTAGAVDLVMTPVGGFGWIVSEDAVDKHFIKRFEEGRSDGMKRAMRIIFNPNRSVANVLRFKKPWYRDTRTMSWDK